MPKTRIRVGQIGSENAVAGRVVGSDGNGNSVWIDQTGGGSGGGGGGFPFWYVDGIISIGNNVEITYVVPYASTLESVTIHLKASGDSGSSVINIYVNGISIFNITTPPSLGFGVGSGSVTVVPNSTELLAGDVVTMGITNAAVNASGLSVFLNGSAGSPIVTNGYLSNMQDVSITGTQTNGQPLVWNSSTGKWQPGESGVDILQIQVFS